MVDLCPVVVLAFLVTGAHLTDGRLLVPIVVLAVGPIFADQLLVLALPRLLLHEVDVLLGRAARLAQAAPSRGATRAEGGAAATHFLDRHAGLATGRHLVAVDFGPGVTISQKQIVLAQVGSLAERAGDVQSGDRFPGAVASFLGL